MFVGWVPVDVFALSTEKCPFSVSRCDLSGVGGRKWMEREDWLASFFDHWFEWLEVSVIIGIDLQNKTTGENKQDVHSIDNKSFLTERKF